MAAKKTDEAIEDVADVVERESKGEPIAAKPPVKRPAVAAGSTFAERAKAAAKLVQTDDAVSK